MTLKTFFLSNIIKENMKYSKKGDESFAQYKEKYEYSIKRKLEF